MQGSLLLIKRTMDISSYKLHTRLKKIITNEKSYGKSNCGQLYIA